MAWTSMHFATGMISGGLIAASACLLLRRGWRFIPLAMTTGGLWALVPDMPRLWREDFPGLPFASALGSKNLERSLHEIGDIFFFHHQLDAQPHEYALHGLIMIISLYTLCILQMLWLERKSRNSIANRAWIKHKDHLPPHAKGSTAMNHQDTPHLQFPSQQDNLPGQSLVDSANALQQQLMQNQRDQAATAQPLFENGLAGRIVPSRANQPG